MDTNKMRALVRERFEVWFRKEYQLAAGDEINFANGGVRMMLKAWQASREDVVVELPNEIGDGVRDCRAAIEAQGLRVSP